MVDFAKYCFNRSHAACYALVAYQTAYLKYYYPKQYLVALLNHSEFEKYPAIFKELKDAEIEVVHPNINTAMPDFSLVGGKILYGLNAIKGLGTLADVIVKERNRRGPYRSLAFLRNPCCYHFI